MNDIKLEGCSPVPMAHYLKALGIFRVIAEQKDPDVRGYWKDDKFHIITQLTREDLINFFLNEYNPTPILNPWAGRGGFLEGDDGTKSTRAGAVMVRMLGSTNSTRFQAYRSAISKLLDNSTIRNLNDIRTQWKKLDAEKNKLKKTDDSYEELKTLVNDAKREEQRLKTLLLHSIRSSAPDIMVDWIDSCLVLPSYFKDNASMAPILGTGGNDGSQDFSVNFMQRLDDIMDIETGDPKPNGYKLLENALYSSPIDLLVKKPIGQYNPSAVGGYNATSGFESDWRINPWDFILTIEGAILFSSAAVKRLNYSNHWVPSSPFTVKQSNAGYGSSSTDDIGDSRGEIWIPIWGPDYTIGILELKKLMSEGRVQIGKHYANNGVDFARAISTLGVDRGISSFQRFGLLKRNGKNYFATPLGRFRVKRQPQIDLINDIDTWLNGFRSKANSDKAPSSISRIANNLDNAIMDICTGKSVLKLQNVLILLGHCEKEIAKSSNWAKASYIQPVPYLSKRWLKECDDGTPEYRLAVGMASIYGKYGQLFFSIRKNAEPVIDARKPFFKFEDNEDINEVVDSSGSLVDFMNNVLSRRLIKAQQEGCETYPDMAGRYASIGDITDFIEGRVNERKIFDLFWGMVLVNWKDGEKVEIQSRERERSLTPNAGYMLVKLCYSGIGINDRRIPIIPQIHRLARNGNGSGAVDMAVRRLRATGVSPSVNNMYLSPPISKRIAAAVLFPVHERQIKEFLSRITVESNDKLAEITQEV